MKLPDQYVKDLDHRITVLLTFTVRRDAGYFGLQYHGETKHLGDVYRACLEGAAIMLRMSIEFLGLKGESKDGSWKLAPSRKKGDFRLGDRLLSDIPCVESTAMEKADPSLAEFIARIHDEASKRTAHAAFNKISTGLDPRDLRKATKWVLREIWARCYAPEPITIHGDLFRLLEGGKWEGVAFRPAN